LGKICDYEGSAYRTEFWEGQGRDYEDAAERIALRKLLPPRGEVVVEVGAGYGRLAELYEGYRRVILVDYSRSLLVEARERWGENGRFVFVVADLHRLPLVDEVAETLVTVRVLHHVSDVPMVLSELGRVVAPRGCYVLEYANKRNLKEILRWLVGRSRKEPFSWERVEFAPLNYNFHPRYIEEALDRVGLQIERRLSVSLFRMGFLKQRFPRALACLDGWLQGPTAPLTLGPSIFLRSRKEGDPKGDEGLFQCPKCRASLEEGEGMMTCPECERVWWAEEGIYDFR
jgi:ubiquinone/menaquinone biosynthesis C-methylase UbiE